MVELDGSPALHGGNHDIFTFRRGMDCAVCRQFVRICCNKCLVCHSYGYSNPMGYQTSDFRPLMTIPPNPQHPSPP